MKGRLCKWQRTLLDTNINAHFSWCTCPDSEYGYDTIVEGRCLKCEHRKPVSEDDKLADSLAETIDVELDERSDEEVQQIIDTHCKKCEQYTEANDVCKSATCGCHTVVKATIKSLHSHCPDGIWE